MKTKKSKSKHDESVTIVTDTDTESTNKNITKVSKYQESSSESESPVNVNSKLSRDSGVFGKKSSNGSSSSRATHSSSNEDKSPQYTSTAKKPVLSGSKNNLDSMVSKKPPCVVQRQLNKSICIAKKSTNANNNERNKLIENLFDEQDIESTGGISYSPASTLPAVHKEKLRTPLEREHSEADDLTTDNSPAPSPPREKTLKKTKKTKSPVAVPIQVASASSTGSRRGRKPGSKNKSKEASGQSGIISSKSKRLPKSSTQQDATPEIAKDIQDPKAKAQTQDSKKTKKVSSSQSKFPKCTSESERTLNKLKSKKKTTQELLAVPEQNEYLSESDM